VKQSTELADRGKLSSLMRKRNRVIRFAVFVWFVGCFFSAATDQSTPHKLMSFEEDGAAA
jgi:hypothetical protein